jgi:molecular chaperone DnaK (HSP70)
MSRHRLIVGLDYGTTYTGKFQPDAPKNTVVLTEIITGVSYVSTDKKSIDDVVVIRSWPGKESGEWKTPTRIAYKKENQGVSARTRLENDAWGYQVDPMMVSCCWTKLLLDQKTPATALDAPGLEDGADNSIYRIPPDKSPQTVCEDFVREVYNFSMASLTKTLTKQVLDATPIDCWLTVPAIWSDQAKLAIRAAVLAAGFGSRENDTISVIAEPEAAAIATLTKHLQPDGINPPQVR